METPKKKKIKERMRSRYRLVIQNDNTFREVWYVVLSLYNIIATVGFLGLLCAGIGIVIVLFTPLREYIPGYPAQNERQMAIENIRRLDSMENIVFQKDLYLDNLLRILDGRETNPHYVEKDSIKKVGTEYITPIKIDSLLYKSVEEDKFSLKNENSGVEFIETTISAVRMHFYCPLKGEITNQYDPATGHFGIDIVSNAKDPILSVLDGTVISAGWTIEAGYVIIVQHKANIISQYKHNAFLLKKIGDRVKAGEPLGIIGNTGEYTTGPHLHFELWQNGTSLNPTDYIIF